MAKRNPDSEAVLSEIEGQEVVIAAFSYETRQGKRRTYVMSQITLDDGRSFSVVGKGVQGPLSYLEPDDFPIGACFTREPSDFEPGAYYWVVN